MKQSNNFKSYAVCILASFVGVLGIEMSTITSDFVSIFMFIAGLMSVFVGNFIAISKHNPEYKLTKWTYPRYIMLSSIPISCLMSILIGFNTLNGWIQSGNSGLAVFLGIFSMAILPLFIFICVVYVTVIMVILMLILAFLNYKFIN